MIIAQAEQMNIKGKGEASSNDPSQRSVQEQIPVGRNRRVRHDQIEPSEDYRRAQEAVLRLGGKVNIEEEKKVEGGPDGKIEAENVAEDEFL